MFGHFGVCVFILGSWGRDIILIAVVLILILVGCFHVIMFHHVRSSIHWNGSCLCYCLPAFEQWYFQILAKKYPIKKKTAAGLCVPDTTCQWCPGATSPHRPPSRPSRPSRPPAPINSRPSTIIGCPGGSLTANFYTKWWRMLGVFWWKTP